MSQGGKDGRCIMLTALSPACAECLEILAAWTSWKAKGLSRPEMAQSCILHWEKLSVQTEFSLSQCRLNYQVDDNSVSNLTPLKLHIYRHTSHLLGKAEQWLQLWKLHCLPIKEYLYKLFKNQTTNPSPSFPVNLYKIWFSNNGMNIF